MAEYGGGRKIRSCRVSTSEASRGREVAAPSEARRPPSRGPRVQIPSLALATVRQDGASCPRKLLTLPLG